ncbi:MAG: WD40/YVTN/BNR-like repeat-containing protein [Planctomycetota bacterium]
MTGLVAHPTTFDIYIKTDVGGIYRLDRSNWRWIPLMDQLPFAEAESFDVASLALDPQDANTIAIVAMRDSGVQSPNGGNYGFGEVLVSNDAGQSWAPQGLLPLGIRVGPNGEYRGFSGERLAIDPNVAGRMLLATRVDGVFVRQQAGAGLWTQSNGTPTVTAWNNGDPNDLEYAGNTPGHTFALFDPNSATLANGATSVAYFGDHESGVYRSTDGGLSWSLLAGSPIHAVHGMVQQDGRLYVSCARYAVGPDQSLPEIGSVHRFDPASSSWTDITPSLPGQPGSRDNRPYAGLSSHPSDPAQLVLTAGAGPVLYRTYDRGNTWQRIEPNNASQQPSYWEQPSQQNFFTSPGSWGTVSVLMDPSAPERLFQTNGFGVIRTDNLAATTPSWTWTMDNLEELVIHNVVSPPVPFEEGGADLLMACMDEVGLRIESFNEVPTVKVSKPIFLGQANAIAYSYQNPQFAACVGWDTWQPTSALTGFTSDNGQTWTSFADESPGVGGGLGMSATNPQNMVWEPSQGALHYTTDGGASWTLGRNLDAAFDPNNPQTYWRLESAWGVQNPWWIGEHIAADKVDGGRFYRLSYGKFFYSTDGGANWREGFDTAALGGNGPFAYTVHARLVTHPTRTGEVYICEVPNSDQTLLPPWRSTDGGQTIQAMPGLQWATQVAFGLGDRAAVPFVYVHGVPLGETEEGIWLSRDDGQSWELVSDPAVDKFARITSLEGDMRRRLRVYVGTNGRGVKVGQYDGTTARLRSFGDACGPTSAPFTQTADPLPTLGAAVSYRASGAWNNAVGLFVLGDSDQNMQGLPLPLSLAAIGAGSAGCFAYTNLVASLASVSSPSGELVQQVAVPNNSALVGFTFFSQHYTFGSGSGGATALWSSNAIETRVGY